MVLALQAAQARKIAVVTPYQDSVNTQLAAFLEAGGIEVLVLNSFRAATVQELGQITSAQVDALARSTMTNDCDAMLIACSQLPTIDLLQSLQESFGRPVFSSVQSTAWQVGKVLDAINAGTAA
jgi:maleate cis-trans isomerase